MSDVNDEEFKGDKIEDVTPEPPKDTPDPAATSPEILGLIDFFSFLESFRSVKRHLTAMPTFTPRTFWEQVQFVDDGATRKIAVWINGTWRSVAVT